LEEFILITLAFIACAERARWAFMARVVEPKDAEQLLPERELEG